MADPITAFATLMESQGPTFMGKPKDIVNTLTKRNYTSAFLIGGRKEREVFKAGPVLKDRILLTATDRGEWYLPAGYEKDYQNPQTGTEMTANWRFYMFDVAWTDQEIMMDVPTGVGKRYAAHQLKELMFQKRQVAHTNAVNAMEYAKWAPPVYADMEATGTAKRPQSILSFVNEYTDATSGIHVPPSATGGASWGSTVQTIPTATAATNTAWDNQSLTYSSVGGDTADTKYVAGGDLVGKLKRMRRKLSYQKLPGKPQYGDMASAPHIIASSEWGCEAFSTGLRGGKDTWGAAEMEDGTLTVGGVEIVYISELDTTPAYIDTTNNTLVAEDSADADFTGPRFYFLTKDALRQVFFKERYFHSHKPGQDIRQPTSWIQNFEVWCQLWCRDRRKLGVVHPSAQISQ